MGIFYHIQVMKTYELPENLQVNADRIHSRLKALAQIGALENGGVQRLALTDDDARARRLLMEWLEAAGTEVRIDRIGNVFGIRKGSEDGPAVLAGSHLDTVKGGGRYDGALGVVAALEVMEVLNEREIETLRPFAAVNFTNEEGVRFAPGMTGSKAFAEPGGAQELLDIRAAEEETTLAEELERTGFSGKESCGFLDVYRFLELHIEQGPLLERERVPIGVVESVQGIYWTEYAITGASGHAGTTPMNMRKDAGHAAARIVGYLREMAGEIGGVATAGFLELKPNAVNVIPGEARIRVDFRHPEAAMLRKGQEMLDEYVKACCMEEGVDCQSRELIRQPPVRFDPGSCQVLEEACGQLGYESMRMDSGAGHDAQAMASACPSAMVFIPCRDGISHNEKEYAEPEHIEKGIQVLLHAVLHSLNEPDS